MTDFQRDRWGRPLVSDPNGGDKPLPYKRPSSYGGVLDDKFSLGQWQQRMAVLGIAQRPDLLAQAAALGQTDEKGVNAKLNQLVEDAIEAAGGNAGRRLGDALHNYIALINRGTDVAVIAPWDADIAAYKAALEFHDFRALPDLVEVQLVCDTWGAAGSADIFLEYIGDTHPKLKKGDVVVADAKTGKSISSPNTYLVQQTIYAHSQRYDTETGVRSPIHPRLRTDLGYIVHLPAGQGICTFHELDLKEGAQRTSVAQVIHELQKDKTFMSVLTKPSSTTVEPSTAAAATPVVDDNPIDARLRWANLVTRFNLIIEQPQGKKVLSEQWLQARIAFKPKELGQKVDEAFHPSATLEMIGELNAVHTVIEAAERILGMPFSDLPAPTPPVRPHAPAPQPPQPLDEGKPADTDAVAALARRIKAFGTSWRTLAIKSIAADANKAKGSISLRVKPTVRRFEIGRALCLAAELTSSSEDMLALLAAALDHVDANGETSTVAQRIARIGAGQAADLAHIIDSLEGGAYGVTYDGNARMRIVPIP